MWIVYSVYILYVINYTYLYHHIVVLDRYTNSNLVFYKRNADDEPYESKSSVLMSNLGHIHLNRSTLSGLMYIQQYSVKHVMHFYSKTN